VELNRPPHGASPGRWCYTRIASDVPLTWFAGGVWGLAVGAGGTAAAANSAGQLPDAGAPQHGHSGAPS
jgi:hypothetical protein